MTATTTRWMIPAIASFCSGPSARCSAACPAGQRPRFWLRPGPALIAMGREAGYQMAGYDKFYADEPELLAQQYDFITSTEVIEHIATPRAVLERLWGCLKPGGLLVLQTQRVLGTSAFGSGATATIRPTSSSSPRPPFAPWQPAGRRRSSFPRGCGGHRKP